MFWRPSKNLLLDAILIATPIICGSVVYLLFRGQTIFVFGLVEILDLSSVMQEARLIARPFNPYFQGFVLYSAPAGLWAFSFIYSITVVWRGALKSVGAVAAISLVVLLVEGMEAAQAFGLIAGRFDLLDLTANSFGLLTGGVIGYGRDHFEWSANGT
jgi:hypothetical protein